MEKLYLEELLSNLIFDRKEEDIGRNKKGYYNYSDLNRIELWCKYLKNWLNARAFPINFDTKENWNMKDFPTMSELERIRKNVEKIKSTYVSLASKTEIPSSLNKMDIDKANRIEKILEEINHILNCMEYNYVFVGVAKSGQNRLWQQRFRRIKTWISQPYKINQYTDVDKLKVIASPTDKPLLILPKNLGLTTLDKRDYIYSSIVSINKSMEIIDKLIGNTKVYKLENILSNGKLGNTANWTLSSYNNVNSNGEYTTIIGNVSSTGTNPNYQNFDKIFGRDSSHVKVLYACGKARSRISNTSYPRIYLSYYKNDSTSVTYSNLSSVDGIVETALNDNEWHTFSTRVVTYNSNGYFDYNRIAFGIQKNNVGEEIDFKDIAIFDLTEAFGKGNEPSITWCNQNIRYDGNDIIIDKECL